MVSVGRSNMNLVLRKFIMGTGSELTFMKIKAIPFYDENQ
jgi:hypothetical protein